MRTLFPYTTLFRSLESRPQANRAPAARLAGSVPDHGGPWAAARGRGGGTAIAELFQNRLDCDAHPYYDTHLRGVRVSAHFVIRRAGELEQYVSCEQRAWHAGASNFFGRERCNDFSIGIELEGTDAVAFEAAQYETLGALVKALTTRYPIAALAGHSDIAPGRKTDPGPHFEWPRLQRDTALADQYFPYLKFFKTP